MTIHENDEGLRWHVLTTRSFDFLVARAEAAEADNARMRVEVITGGAYEKELEAEVERLRTLWQRAIDADILDDAHELGNAIADASWLLNYPPPEDANTSQDAA